MIEQSPNQDETERVEEERLSQVERFLRENDPSNAFPEGLSERKRRRMVRYMEHPVLATIYLHHRVVAIACAVTFLALLFAALVRVLWHVPVRPMQPVAIYAEKPLPVLKEDPETIPDIELPDDDTDRVFDRIEMNAVEKLQSEAEAKHDADPFSLP
ncbi:MAG: hypothetical protein ACI4QT_09265 [Kiritimatiellia bacterium]